MLDDRLGLLMFYFVFISLRVWIFLVFWTDVGLFFGYFRFSLILIFRFLFGGCLVFIFKEGVVVRSV